MKRKYQGDLDHCPFCGILLSWDMENDITFNQVFYFKCKNCGGEISINKNSIKGTNFFDKKNVFVVENVGGYNYSKLKVKEGYSVIDLMHKADDANAEIARLKGNKEKVLNSLLDKEGNVVNAPNEINKKKNAKRFSIALIVLASILVALIITFILIYQL